MLELLSDLAPMALMLFCLVLFLLVTTRPFEHVARRRRLEDITRRDP